MEDIGSGLDVASKCRNGGNMRVETHSWLESFCHKEAVV